MTNLVPVEEIITRIAKALAQITDTLENHKKHIVELEKKIKELEEKVNDHKV